MTDTPRTGLEFVDAGTTDIDQPVNNNALALDAVVGMNVVSATTTAEPTLTSPTDDGKVYIIPAGATGTNWAAQSTGTIAQWYSSNWYFYAPWAGLQARAADSGIRYEYTSSWAVWASVDAQLLMADTDVPRLSTENLWVAPQTVNANSSPGSVPAAQAGTLLHLAQSDATANRLQLSSFGSFSSFQGVRANNTAASPAALASGDVIASFSGSGYDGTSYTTARGNFSFRANSTWTGTSHETIWLLQLTGPSSTAIGSVLACTTTQLYPAVTNTMSLGLSTNTWAAAYIVQMNLSGAEHHTGEQSVSLTANTDNQTINSTTRVLRIASNGAYNLTGLTGGAAGRRLTLLNTSAFTITLTHDATSTAANRFFCPNNTNVSVRQNGSVEVIYDSTSSRYRVIGA